MTSKKEIKQQLKTQGYASAGVWGGPQKITYYAPDGSVSEAIPGYLSDREGVKYDRMLLQGYSLTPPEHPKPHCAGCGAWHDTIEEVKSCIKQRKAQAAKWERWASRNRGKGESVEIKELKDEVGELKKLMKQLLDERK